MCILNLKYLIAIVPIALLLTLSFFVLLVLRKVEEKGLKAFGYVVVSFIWLAALVVFSGAVYKMARGSMMSNDMLGKKMGMSYSMYQREQNDSMPAMSMPPMAMSEKTSIFKKQKNSGMPKCAGNKGIIYKSQ